MSLAMILFAANSGTAKNTVNNKVPGPIVNVRYEVNIHLAAEMSLCNTYLVEILDASGRLVAPVQEFTPGKNLYNFYEQTRDIVGIRIARLVLAPERELGICPQELFTPPAVKLIHFMDHETYNFDLIPSASVYKG